MRRSLSSYFLLLFSFVPRSFAQTSAASCLPYYSWTSNSQGQTPCQVASALLAICNGGTFDVLPLADGQHYEGPALVANANSCICSTVTYSLMTACGMCQGKTYLRWGEWSQNCPNVTFSQFPEPLPSDVRVPAWAYQDIRENDSGALDQFLAKENANAPESSAAPTSTTIPEAEAAAASVEATSTTTASETPTATAESSGSGGEEEEEGPDVQNANRIGGSVVGSLLGAGLIVGVTVFWIRQRRRTPAPAELEGQPKAPEHVA